MMISSINTTIQLVALYSALNIFMILRPSSYILDKTSIVIKIFLNWVFIISFLFKFELAAPDGL